MEFDTLFFRCDRGIFEMFSIPPGSLPSLRIPVRWLGVRVDFAKGRPDRGGIQFGTVQSSSQPLYALNLGTPKLVYLHNPNIRVTVNDEPLLRQYFTQVATRADRAVS